MIDVATKDKFIMELERIPLIAAACRAVGISRATVYRWRNDDKEFSSRMEQAVSLGREDWCDLAESKLVAAVRRGEPWALRYLLEFNHPRYYKPRKPISAPTTHRHLSTLKIKIINPENINLAATIEKQKAYRLKN